MNLWWRLPFGGERRNKEHPTRACQEPAAVHYSIISSARPSSDAGIAIRGLLHP
jgi:hypothetical protein